MHLLTLLLTLTLLQAEPEAQTAFLIAPGHKIQAHVTADGRTWWHAQSETMTPEELVRRAREWMTPRSQSEFVRWLLTVESSRRGLEASLSDFEGEPLGGHSALALSVPAGGSGALVGDLDVVEVGPDGPPNFGAQAVVLYDTARIILAAGSDGITGMGWSMTDLVPTDVRGYLYCELPDGAFISLLLNPGVQPNQTSFAVLLALDFVDGSCVSWVGSCTLGAYPFDETVGSVEDMAFDNVIVIAE